MRVASGWRGRDRDPSRDDFTHLTGERTVPVRNLRKGPMHQVARRFCGHHESSAEVLGGGRCTRQALRRRSTAPALDSIGTRSGHLVGINEGTETKGPSAYYDGQR